MFVIKAVKNSHVDKIVSDKIIILHENMPITLIGNVLGCIPLANILWPSEPHALILSWVGCIFLLSLVRWVHQRRFDARNASLNSISNQGKAYVVLAAIAGMVWGSVAFLFFRPESFETFTGILLTLMVVIGGSMAALSSRPFTHLVFALPACIPLIVIMFLQDSVLYKWSCFGTLVYMAVSFTISHNMHRVIHNSLELKYQNIDLVRDLKKQTDTANKANTDKSRFLAAASHDLRQPLHAVNLFVESLGQKLTSVSEKTDLVHIRQGLDSLDELFNSLLDISQIDSDTLRISKNHFSLDQLMSKWVDQYSIQAADKKLKLIVTDCHYFVHTDPVLLEQVIRNLLSNAIRYTKVGQVEVFCDEVGDDIRLHIRDSGIGIPEESKEDIFNEFYQLNNPERDRNKGLGLGLAIVKRISQRLNYQLSYTSVHGEGTEFFVVLPKGEKTERVTGHLSLPTSTIQEDKLTNLKVMIVDNEEEIIQATESIILSWGAQATTAGSVNQALNIIQHGYRPDIILADYRMPGGINGSELIKLIQQQVGNVPGIIITGDKGNDVVAEINAANQARLTKPIKPAQLRIVMNHLINQ